MVQIAISTVILCCSVYMLMDEESQPGWTWYLRMTLVVGCALSLALVISGIPRLPGEWARLRELIS